MDPNDRQRLKALLILLIVLVAAVWVGRRIYRTPATPPAGNANLASGLESDGALTVIPLEAEAFARLTTRDEMTRRNPFQYVQESPVPPALTELTPDRSGSTDPTVGRVEDAAPLPPPPAAAIPFTYAGYATVGPSGEAMGLLFDDGQSFTVSVDEVLMGRYRIRSLTEAFVEIEDLDNGRLQRLPRGLE